MPRLLSNEPNPTCPNLTLTLSQVWSKGSAPSVTVMWTRLQIQLSLPIARTLNPSPNFLLVRTKHHALLQQKGSMRHRRNPAPAIIGVAVCTNTTLPLPSQGLPYVQVQPCPCHHRGCHMYKHNHAPAIIGVAVCTSTTLPLPS